MTPSYPEQPVASYPLEMVDQFAPVVQREIAPGDPELLCGFARALAADATIYGLPAAYQYAEMYTQAVDAASPRYTGFGVFSHDRELARPGYAAFTTPNADTLYSNAWLDLTQGPVVLDIPEFGSRYYTVNLLDMYSNATNLSSRTVGPSGGRFLLVTPDWMGEAPADVTVFRVATRYLWLLVRIFVDGSEHDLAAAHALQDRISLTPTSTEGTGNTCAFPVASPDAVREDWRTFFAALDFVLRACGHPVQEDAYAYRFRTIGVGGLDGVVVDDLADELKAGMAAGFSDALRLVRACQSQLGNPIHGAQWNRGTAGVHGFNYLRRAVANDVGLGATVPAENQAFTTFRDADGRQLDGSRHRYRITLAPPPPVDAFWSVTVYDATTRHLVPNDHDRHVVNSSSPSVRGRPGESVEITVSRTAPGGNTPWLPAPDGPFYLVIRAYLPHPEVISGPWQPRPVCRDDIDDPSPEEAL